VQDGAYGTLLRSKRERTHSRRYGSADYIPGTRDKEPSLLLSGAMAASGGMPVML
jgi:hypothetical protein